MRFPNLACPIFARRESGGEVLGAVVVTMPHVLECRAASRANGLRPCVSPAQMVSSERHPLLGSSRWHERSASRPADRQPDGPTPKLATGLVAPRSDAVTWRLWVGTDTGTSIFRVAFIYGAALTFSWTRKATGTTSVAISRPCTGS